MKLRTLALLVLLVLVPAAAQHTYPALLASGPAPELKDKLMLFGQFIGVWTFEGREISEDGSQRIDKGEIHFQWVLQGRAVQDVWLETERSDSGPKTYGTTVRFYDPATNTWKMTWNDPVNRVVKTMVGRKVGDEIVVSGLSSEGLPFRWIFSEIKPNSFHWHAEILSGKDWRTYEDLQARRKQ